MSVFSVHHRNCPEERGDSENRVTNSQQHSTSNQEPLSPSDRRIHLTIVRIVERLEFANHHVINRIERRGTVLAEENSSALESDAQERLHYSQFGAEKSP
jgi:hypothetical protein